MEEEKITYPSALTNQRSCSPGEDKQGPSDCSIAIRSSASTDSFKTPNQLASTVNDSQNTSIVAPIESCATVSSHAMLAKVPAGISQAYPTSTTDEQSVTVSCEPKEASCLSAPKTLNITYYNVHKPLSHQASLMKTDSTMEESQPPEGRNVSETETSNEQGSSNHVLSMDIPASNEFNGDLDFTLEIDHGILSEVVCGNTDVRTKPPLSTETQSTANFGELLERNITSSIELLDQALNNIEESSSSSPSTRVNENKGNLECNSTFAQNRNVDSKNEVTDNSLFKSMGGSPITKLAQDAQSLPQPSSSESDHERLFGIQESSGSIIRTNISENEFSSATKITKGTALAFPCLPSSSHRIEEVFTSTVVLESLKTPDIGGSLTCNINPAFEVPEAASNNKQELKLQKQTIFQECTNILDPVMSGTKTDGIELAPNTLFIRMESDTQPRNDKSSGNMDVLIHKQMEAPTVTATDASQEEIHQSNKNHYVSKVSGDTRRSVEPKVSPETACSQGIDAINKAFLNPPFTDDSDDSHHAAEVNSSYTGNRTPLSGQASCDAVPQNEKEVFQLFPFATDKYNINERHPSEGSTVHHDGKSSDLHAAPKGHRIETHSIQCLRMDTQPTKTSESFDHRGVSDQEMLEITQAMNNEFSGAPPHRMDTQDPTDSDRVLDCSSASDYEMEDSMEEQGQKDSSNNSMVLEMPSAGHCATSVVIGPQNVLEAGRSFEYTDGLIFRSVANPSGKGAVTDVFMEGSRRTKLSACLAITDNPKNEVLNLSTVNVNTKKTPSNSAFMTKEQNATETEECMDIVGVSAENLREVTPTGRNDVLLFSPNIIDRQSQRVSEKLNNSVVNTDQEMQIAGEGYSDQDSQTLPEAEPNEPDNTEGLNIEGLNTEDLNTEDLDTKGLNTEGLNAEGLNTEGLNIQGLNTEGLTIEGLNAEGLNTKGLNTEGLNTEGLNIQGLNTEGLTIECLNTECLNTECLNTECLNIEGLNTEGLNTEDLNIEGLDTEGLNTEGLNIEGLDTEDLSIESLNIDVTKMMAEKKNDITSSEGIGDVFVSATPLLDVCTSSSTDIKTVEMVVPEECFQGTSSASSQEMIDAGANGKDDVIPVEGVFECTSVVGHELKDTIQDIGSRAPEMKVKHMTGHNQAADYCGRLCYEIRDAHIESVKAPPKVIPEAKNVEQTMGAEADEPLEHCATSNSAHKTPDTAQEVLKEGRKICVPKIVVDTVADSPEHQPLQHVGCFESELRGTVNHYMIESSNAAVGVLAVRNPNEFTECSEHLVNEEVTNAPNEESHIPAHGVALEKNNKLNPVESHRFIHEMHVTAPVTLEPQALMNNTLGSVRSSFDVLSENDCNVPPKHNVAQTDMHFECYSSPIIPAISDDLRKLFYEVAEVDDKHFFPHQVDAEMKILGRDNLCNELPHSMFEVSNTKNSTQIQLSGGRPVPQSHPYQDYRTHRKRKKRIWNGEEFIAEDERRISHPRRKRRQR